MAFETRGGFPTTIVFTAAIAASAALSRRQAPAITKQLRIRNKDATNFLKVFWSEAEFTADTNFMVVEPEVATKDTVAYIDAEVKELWFKADTAPVVVEVTYFSRRG